MIDVAKLSILSKKVNEVIDENWQEFPKDCFCGEDAESMKGKDLIQYQGYCLQKGYGGFTIYNDTAYFKYNTSDECLENVKSNKVDNNCTTYIAPKVSQDNGLGLIIDGYHGGYHGVDKHGFMYYKKSNDKLPNPLWDTHMDPHKFCTNCKFIRKHSHNIDEYQCLGH